MGRPRKPTQLHAVTGSYRHDPQRRRKAEPEPAGDIGAPSASLSEDARAAWNDIVSQCCPGVLGLSDRVALELAAGLLADFRTGRLSGARLSILVSLLGRFGMTPADRSKVTVRNDEQKSPAKKYLA